jgi:hypothetical protein
MIRQSYLVCGAGLILAIAACDSSTGVSTNISQADANKLAADIDASSTLGPADFGLGPSFSVGVPASGATASVAAAPTTFNNTFDVTRQCPKGGSVEINGSINGTGDRTTHSLTVDATATRTDAACAFEARDGGIISVNGNIIYKAHLNIVNGAFVDPQTQSHVGSITWTRTGAAPVTCDINVVSSFDPATHTVTVKGTLCGRTIDVTRTRGG